MNVGNTLVVLDTCVQLKLRLSDVLMDMRAEHLFSAHWTEAIDEEFLRNLVRVHGVDALKAQRRLQAMKARCPEWEGTLTSADFEAVSAAVDEKDRHMNYRPPSACGAVVAVSRVLEHPRDSSCPVSRALSCSRSQA